MLAIELCRDFFRRISNHVVNAGKMRAFDALCDQLGMHHSDAPATQQSNSNTFTVAHGQTSPIFGFDGEPAPTTD